MCTLFSDSVRYIKFKNLDETATTTNVYLYTKLLNKPWLTSGILKSIEIKNRLHKRMCRAKDPLHKEELAIKVKNYRNTILELTQRSKANHFTKYFQDNKLNTFKT